jgi:RNA polymerase primary sigma factor
MASAEDEDHKSDDQDGEISLDMSQAQVKRMIAEAREKGYITYDQLNTVLPPDQVSSEQIEDVMSMLSEMGINIIEDDDVDEDTGNTDLVTTGTKDVAVAASETEKLDRTDDPVRMYLREMGSVELLSREGEIAIAKRIEAGRNTMIMGLCESPLTFQAITIWRDELLSEDILLRDVIDLEATFGNQLGDDVEVESVLGTANVGGASPAGAKSDEQEFDADGNPISRDDDDEDDDQSNMSLSAMETALKPKVL